MDFITGLPKSQGYEAIFVVVDRLSKYGHFIPLKNPQTTRKVAEIFTKEVSMVFHNLLLVIVTPYLLAYSGKSYSVCMGLY